MHGKGSHDEHHGSRNGDDGSEEKGADLVGVFIGFQECTGVGIDKFDSVRLSTFGAQLGDQTAKSGILGVEFQIYILFIEAERRGRSVHIGIA